MKKALTVFVSLFAVSMVLTKPLDLATAKGGSNAPRPVTTPISVPVSSAISGTIHLVSSPLSGIRVILFKLLPRESKVTEVVTDSNGNFTFSAIPNGNYKIMPKDRNYSFSPVSQTVTVTGNSITNINFQASN